MKTRNIAVMGILLSFLVTNMAGAALQPVQIKGDQGDVSFLAIGKPSFLKIKGSAKGPSGRLEQKDGKWVANFEFDLKQLDTGIALRDTHMKEKYLEVAKHPKAQLTVTDLKLPADWNPTKSYSGKIPFTGDLELHGEKRPVEGVAELNSGTAGTNVTAKFSVKLTEYKVDIPRYAGVSVADNVDVEVALKNLK